MTNGLTTDSVVVDLGFNEGHFTREVVRRFGCHVYATEPLPALRRSLDISPVVDLDGVAVTGSGGAIVLHDNPSRCATVVTSLAEAGAEDVRVESVTLGQFLDRVPFGVEVSVLKVDIEGAELSVLSSVPLASLARVRQLTVEFHEFLDGSAKEDIAAVISRMAGFGFTHVPFARDNTDVLFIRSRLLRIPRLARAWLVVRYKIPRGLGRIAQRHVSRRSTSSLGSSA